MRTTVEPRAVGIAEIWHFFLKSCTSATHRHNALIVGAIGAEAMRRRENGGGWDREDLGHSKEVDFVDRQVAKRRLSLEVDTTQSAIRSGVHR